MADELHVVLLAAGNASRFGGAKQTAAIDGVAMVRRAAQSALATGASVIVVTGAHLEAVSSALVGLGVVAVHNPSWESGMGGSIARGIGHLLRTSPRSAAGIICLTDQPFVGATQLRKLIDDPRTSPDRILAAQHGDTLGPPCLFPRRYYEELAALSGTQGARKLLERHKERVAAVPMPEAAIDVDTREDYERLLAGRRADWGAD